MPRRYVCGRARAAFADLPGPASKLASDVAARGDRCLWPDQSHSPVSQMDPASRYFLRPQNYTIIGSVPVKLVQI